MADTRHRTTWGTRFRFLVRGVGLTGVLAALAGAALFASAFPNHALWTPDTLRDAGEGAHGDFAKSAAWTLVAGLVAVAIAFVVELLGGLLQSTGRRSVANTSATVGTVAAVALLIFVNAYSFTHHKRFDLTKEQQFTLPSELADRLRTLRPETPTTIVVLQMHRTFGLLNQKRDSYTKAAEEKVTEKVKDLVDLFRELGPRFNVEVLDTEAFEYEKHLGELTATAPELKAAIEAAPENSIVFHANKRVQRLSFNEFLQLDRTASKEANGGRSNLVLQPQGIESFARRVLAVQERRPKVAICVVHELLTSAYPEGDGQLFTMAGLKQSLTDHGYDVIDIVMKKNWNKARSPDDLKSAADTRAESTLDRLEGELAAATVRTGGIRRQAKVLADRLQAFSAVKDKPWADRRAVYEKYYRGPIAEADETDILDTLKRSTKQTDLLATEAEAERRLTESRLKVALLDDRTTEDRRIADAKAKLTQKLADVDLVIVPRFTIDDATKRADANLSSTLHTWRKEQVDVLRDYMASGKPVLACLGPISLGLTPEPDETQAEFDKRLREELAAAADDFEKLLAERGIELGRETILFDGEARAIAARLAGDQFGGSVPADIPPLAFTGVPEKGSALKPNPVAESLRLTARGVEQSFDLRVRSLRPVYLAPGLANRAGFVSEFVASSPHAWNEERPFLERRQLSDGRVAIGYIPRFEDTKEQDPKDSRVGTHSAERKGPFPVGVAVEGVAPDYRIDVLLAGGSGFDQLAAAAVATETGKPKGTPGRLIVYGSGNLFSGPILDPAREKLLLHSANWLTGRDDRLPRADLPSWQFPRVAMSERDVNLWRYGTALGLPLLAVYLGLMATMFRRLR